MACFYAQGTVITVEDELAAAQIVGGVVSFTLGDGQAQDIDVTTLASTAKEYCQGLQDLGDFTMEINRDFTDVGQVELDDAKNAQSTRNFEITFEDGTTITFAGNVKSFTIEGAQDDVIRSTATVKISGNITITPAP
jgi:hypothetical protein